MHQALGIYSIYVSIICHRTVTVVLLSVLYSNYCLAKYCGVEFTSTPITIKITVELLWCGNETTE